MRLSRRGRFSSSMKCTFVQNAISILWATLLQYETDTAFRPAHSNRLALPHGFGSESSKTVPDCTHGRYSLQLANRFDGNARVAAKVGRAITCPPQSRSALTE